MKLPPLVSGTLIKRYKRFLADVELDTGETITAHCANPGAMMGLNDPGNRVWLSKSDNPKRKLAYSWELVEVDGTLIGINTSMPNKLAEEAIAADRITELTGYETMRREVKYGKNSRIDILLEGGLLEDAKKPLTYVEVKNVHLMREPGLAEFPDSVTARGAKHLVELGDMADQGHRAVMLYLVQYPGTTRFKLADDIDTKYAAALEIARGRGVETLCYGCDITTDKIELTYQLDIEI